MKEKLEHQKIKGLVVFCNKCKRNITHKVTTTSCNHPIDKQIYKAVIKLPNSGGQRRTKNLVSRNFDDALLEFIEFKKTGTQKVVAQQVSIKKTQLLKEALASYLDFLADSDTPFHLRKHLTISYLKSTESLLFSFIKFLRKDGIDINSVKVSEIDDFIIGRYCEYLIQKGSSNFTFNAKIKVYRTFFKYLIDNQDYVIRNYWKKVPLKSEKPTDVSINSKDFNSVLEIITPTNSIKKIGKTTHRNMYRDWLKDVIKLKAFTGRRNAELFQMRWDMIYFENGQPIYIQSPNIKVNLQKNNIEERDYEYSYIPIGVELKELLDVLNLEENKNSTNYIIAPECESRDDMAQKVSRYFTFYFNKLERKYSRSFKDLRKTYITSEDLFINNGISMQHAKYSTTSKHYVNKKEVAKYMVENGFRIFPK